MTGTARTSAGEYGVTSTVNSGDAVSATGHVHSVSSYPVHAPAVWEYAAWVTAGSTGAAPKPSRRRSSKITTSRRITNGLAIAITDHTLQWGDGKSQSWTDEGGTFTCDPSTGALAGTHAFDYVLSGTSHTIEKTLTGTVYANGDVGCTVSATNDGTAIYSFQAFVDEFRGELWHAVASIATGTVCVAATIVVGGTTWAVAITMFGAGSVARCLPRRRPSGRADS